MSPSSTLHNFPDVTTSTVYVTACDFEKSSDLNKIVEITGRMRSTIHV